MSSLTTVHPSSARLTPGILRFALIVAVLLGILGAPLSMVSGTLIAAPATQSNVSVQAVSLGWSHACVLLSTGEVRCWGRNENGQINVPADLGPVSQISAGFSHTCAVTTAGAVQCWGSNDYGETNVPADLGPINHVSAGAKITCTVNNAGTMRCWGMPLSGQIKVPTDLGSVNQISSSIGIPGTGTTCALTSAGTVRCWGNMPGLDEQGGMPRDLGPRKQVSVGGQHACGLDAQGSLRCWGGDGTTPADLGPVSQVSAGFNHTCAVTTAGTVRCWGGDASDAIRVPADLGPVSQVSAGNNYTCAVTTAGGLRCWGDPLEGQPEDMTGNGVTTGDGTGDGTGNTTPMPIPSIGQVAGLVYSAGGQQYLVDLNNTSSATMGTAPPVGSIIGPDNTLLWIEVSDSWRPVDFNDRQPFQILRANRDGSDRQVILESSAFYQQFPTTISLTFSHFGSSFLPKLVLSADATQVFFVACNPLMGEAAVCAFYQLDLASRTVSLMQGQSFGVYPGWVHPDGQRAIYTWDLACSGSLERTNSESTWLSGTPISVVWLADLSFIYSRYICKGVWGSEPVSPQYDIVLANADGSDNRVLVAGKVASAMVLAPDQQTLAFITSDPGQLQSGEVALWVVNLDGSGLRKVIDLPKHATDLRWTRSATESTAQTSPRPSPVSTLPTVPTTGEIAYVQDGNIYLLNLASRKTTPLVTDGTVGLPGEWRGGIQLTWSPDGQRLAYASNRAGNYDIYVLDVASGSTEQFSSNRQDEYLPSFAPDGALFFVRITKAHEHNQIVGEWDVIRAIKPGQETVVATDYHVVDKIEVLADDHVMMMLSSDMGWGQLATGKAEVVWNNGNYNCAWPAGGQSTFDASWSPDGTTLAVIAADCPQGDSSGNWRNALLLIDAGKPNAEPRRILGNEYWGSAIDWAPDNAWLVYAGGISGGTGGLWLISAAGGVPQRISELGDDPAWRPDVSADQAQATVAATMVPSAEAKNSGSIDLGVAPTMVAGSAVASDSEPPTVKIFVVPQGDRWLVTITAEDRGSGVKQVLYSTDGQRYQFYQGPFAVNADEVTMLYAFAEDDVANRSSVVTYTVTRSNPQSLAGYVVGITLSLVILLGGAFVAVYPRISPTQRLWAQLVALAGGALLLVQFALLFIFAFVGRLDNTLVTLPSDVPSLVKTVASTTAEPTISSRQPTSTSILAPTVTVAPISTMVSGVITQPSSNTDLTTLPRPQVFADPPLVPREAWNADAPGSGLIPHTPVRIVLSHEARNCCAGDALAARVRSNQIVHLNNGWPDIAYHYIIAPDGTIFAGRDVMMQSNSSYAAANPSYQLDGSIVIGVLGNYDLQEPTAASVRSITWLMAWLCQHHTIAPDAIYTLAQVAPLDPFTKGTTTSPGANMPSILAFRTDVKAILAGEREP
ncbi:OmpL47-type beta-barrel domain-containing protein [Candidatus Chloroploca asiatica]|uniref:Peptidoglycan recognition protein family domain-containing protein n=1 Tax=Candidatus Chloroploca asiatica TaxID=1506545 RepID=A0A2H3KSF8_9CHLR|nr:N-acetylmuramoyl-L-alanine amidase [Candidatus Chloroploca asiatica]PDW00589.1 hypothetical protein A9Q02_09370 [Candidatus Chloroploca asiatica]